MGRICPETLYLPRAGGAPRAPRGTRAVVVGGGIAGVSAATILAERGVEVTLLEKEAFLGGRAGAWTEALPSGETFEMERGFHGFFRHYYNLRRLLRRIDPELRMLLPLEDYPVLGPNGERQQFQHLPTVAPFNVAALTLRTPYLTARDLVRVNVPAALALLAFDLEQTASRYDAISAATYLETLRFPEDARRMLFEVFTHSFFSTEEALSAAELLMMFHFYFVGNPEGLVFDVVKRPFSSAIWRPWTGYLEGLGVRAHLGTGVHEVARTADGWRIVHEDGEIDAPLLVLALSVPGLKELVAASPGLEDPAFRTRIDGLTTTRPFGVWRLWLDRPLGLERAPFAGTAGLGLLDNISIYDRFEDESAAWARRSGGSVVELHAYAVPPGLEEGAIQRALLEGLYAAYPEARRTRIVHQRFLLRDDCPGFPPGMFAGRPEVETPLAGLALAGDFVRLPMPAALMERAAASGILAANTLLSRLGVAPEPLHSVPRQGLLAPLPARRSRAHA